MFWIFAFWVFLSSILYVLLLDYKRRRGFKIDGEIKSQAAFLAFFPVINIVALFALIVYSIKMPAKMGAPADSGLGSTKPE